MNFKRALMTLGAAAVLTVAGGSIVNAAESGVVDVPFNFKYLGQEMPAGRYQFHYDASPSAVVLTNLKERTTFQVHVAPGRTKQPITMVFAQQDGAPVLKGVK